MLINKFQEITTSTGNKFSINKEEQYYLRLRCHGKPLSEIQDFFNKSKKEVILLEQGLFLKFDAQNWFELVLKCFLSRTLKYEEFLNNSIRKELVSFSVATCDLYDTGKTYGSLYELREKVLALFVKCDEKMKCSDKFLTHDEKNFLNIKFKYFKTPLVKNKMGLDTSELLDLEVKVFLKMNVDEYFNCFVKGIRFGIIEKSSNVDLNHLITENLKEFEKIIKSNNPFKKQLAYDDLLGLYANVEFNYLMESSYKDLLNK